MMGSPSDYLSSSLADLPRPACRKSFKNIPPENEQRINCPQYGHFVPSAPGSSDVAVSGEVDEAAKCKVRNQWLRKRKGIPSRNQLWYPHGTAKQTICNGTVSGERQPQLSGFQGARTRSSQSTQRVCQHGSQTKLKQLDISKRTTAARKKATAPLLEPGISRAARKATLSNVAASRLLSYEHNESVGSSRKGVDASRSSGRTEKPKSAVASSVAGRALNLSTAAASKSQLAFKSENDERSEDVLSELLRQLTVEGSIGEHQQLEQKNILEENDYENSALVQTPNHAEKTELQAVGSPPTEVTRSEIQQYLIPWLIDSVSSVIKYRLNTLILRDTICQPAADVRETCESCSSPQSVENNQAI
uniref:Uncharacterized protein n=1 Tax=Trichuris muris TaxID=70415 RepID=A0A5S6QDQ4_TRIMR